MTTNTHHHYIICVNECLDEQWAAWFDGMQIVPATPHRGTTTLHGVVRDQAELHGHLCKIRDLGLTLLFVQRCPNQQ